MPDIDRNIVIYDAAVGVTSEEDMTEALLHKAVKNCLYVANMWIPAFNLPYSTAGPFRAGFYVPGARIQICCIYHSTSTPSSPERLYAIHSDTAETLDEDRLAWGISYGEFTDPPLFREAPEIPPVASETRRVVIWFPIVAGSIPPFTAFYRIVGGN